jgi:N-acyl-L-homoserine lactone synthetase
MLVYRDLNINDPLFTGRISFGMPVSQLEKEKIFKLRFDVYGRRKYIDVSKYADGLETDEYDSNLGTKYFFASTEQGEVLGAIRLIQSDLLPTEKIFIFKEPKEISSIAKDRRVELGRLVIVPPDREKKIYLPRNLIFLFLVDTLVDYGTSSSIDGGYVFVKESLRKKLDKLRAPIHYIEDFKQNYPQDGVLYNYFNQKDDPVYPAFFLTKEFKEFTSGIINSSLLFSKTGVNSFTLRSNFYTKFLQLLKII